MANREALRELQTRLAGRLQAAGEGVSVSSWLAVESAGQRYYATQNYSDYLNIRRAPSMAASVVAAGQTFTCSPTPKSCSLKTLSIVI